MDSVFLLLLPPLAIRALIVDKPIVATSHSCRRASLQVYSTLGPSIVKKQKLGHYENYSCSAMEEQGDLPSLSRPSADVCEKAAATGKR